MDYLDCVLLTFTMELAGKIPFDDPVILNYARIGYIATQVFILSCYHRAISAIKLKDDQTMLTYAEPTTQVAQERGKVFDTILVCDYDLVYAIKLLCYAYAGIAIVAFKHVYFKDPVAPFIHAVMDLKLLFDAKVVAIHLLGKPASGHLRRPFTPPGLVTVGLLGLIPGLARDAQPVAKVEAEAHPDSTKEY